MGKEEEWYKKRKKRKLLLPPFKLTRLCSVRCIVLALQEVGGEGHEHVFALHREFLSGALVLLPGLDFPNLLRDDLSLRSPSSERKVQFCIPITK